MTAARFFIFVIFLLLTEFTLLSNPLSSDLDSIFKTSIQQSPHRQQLLRLQDKATDSTDKTSLSLSEAYLRLADELKNAGETAASLLIANRITDELTKSRNKEEQKLLAKAYNLIGNNYVILGNSTQALLNFQKAVKIAESLKSDQLLAFTYNNVFPIYYERGDFDQSINFLEQSLAYHISQNDSTKIIANYNNLGLVFYRLADYDKAIGYMKKAYSYTSADDLAGKSQILTNMAEVYYIQGRFRDAERELQKALNLQQSVPHFNNLQTLLNMATLKAQMGKRQESLALQKKIEESLPDITSLKIRANAYIQLADTKFIMKDSLQGLRFLLAYEQISDSLNALSNDAQLQQLLVAYDTERLKQSNDKLTQSLSISQLKVKNRTLSVYGSIALAAVLGLFIVFLLKKIKSDREKNRIISSQKEQIAVYEKKELERQKKELSQEIDHKNRQLTSYTIDLAANSEFQQQIYNTLNSARQTIDPDNQEALSKINEVLHQLQHNNHEQVSKDFRVYFDEVHPDFLNNLSRLYQQLSKNDLRLCAYLHLGMSTKEIAALTFREIRSVESSRNRLRKKLGLPPESSLQNFLNQLFSNEEDKLP